MRVDAFTHFMPAKFDEKQVESGAGKRSAASGWPRLH